MLMAAAAGFGSAAADESVVTYHGAADRSGLDVAPTLTWTKAAQVRLDASFHAAVDGAVYSQPLYWVPPGGGAARLIVATENNFIYALNAATGGQIWRTSLGAPVPLSELPCGNIDPMGVTGTPAIDPTTGIVYWKRLSKRPAAARATWCSAFRSPRASSRRVGRSTSQTDSPRYLGASTTSPRANAAR
jgi:hypothetical protein